MANTLAKDLDNIENILGGKWKLVRSENLDAYLKMMGVKSNDVVRAALVAMSTMNIERIGDQLRILVNQAFRENDRTFPLDQDVETTDLKGNSIVTRFTWKNNQLTTESKPATPGSRAKAVRITREVKRTHDEERLYMTVTCNDVSMRRIFERQLF